MDWMVWGKQLVTCCSLSGWEWMWFWFASGWIVEFPNQTHSTCVCICGSCWNLTAVDVQFRTLTSKFNLFKVKVQLLVQRFPLCQVFYAIHCSTSLVFTLKSTDWMWIHKTAWTNPPQKITHFDWLTISAPHRCNHTEIIISLLNGVKTNLKNWKKKKLCPGQI